jgi:hypothetical protein
MKRDTTVGCRPSIIENIQFSAHSSSLPAVLQQSQLVKPHRARSGGFLFGYLYDQVPPTKFEDLKAGTRNVESGCG